jgi:hypothetical protein
MPAVSAPHFMKNSRDAGGRKESPGVGKRKNLKRRA